MQLFSSALRLVADDSLAEAGGAPTSSQNSIISNNEHNGALSPPQRPGGNTAGAASSSTSSPRLAASGRPTGPSPQRFRGILTATAHLLTRYLTGGESGHQNAPGHWQSSANYSTITFLTLLSCDALAGVSRLLAVERNRSARARLLTDAHESRMSQFLTKICWFAANILRSRADPHECPLCLAALRCLTHSHALEQWAAHTLRSPASAAAAAGANGQARFDSWMLQLLFAEVKEARLITSSRAAAATVGPAAAAPSAATAARQLLSGRCLQHFLTVQAVSQLHAADGGPLYGLPYDALRPAVLAPARQGQRRKPLSAASLGCAVSFWNTCLSYDPPIPLHPLRPRHLLALCLRTARVALGSLGGEAAAAVLGPGRLQQQGEQQRQAQRWERGQQHGEGQGEEAMAEPTAEGSGGRQGSNSGSSTWLYDAGCGQLRQLLEADNCKQLALRAMTLATLLLHSCSSGGSHMGMMQEQQEQQEQQGQPTVGAGSPGVCRAAVDGAANGSSSSNNAVSGGGGSVSGGDGSERRYPEGSSGGLGGRGSGSECSAAGGAAACVRGLGLDGAAGGSSGQGSSHGSRNAPLLSDPAFAYEWWRLAVATVRATERYDRWQQLRQAVQQQQQQQPVPSTAPLCNSQCLDLLHCGLAHRADMARYSGAWAKGDRVSCPSSTFRRSCRNLFAVVTKSVHQALGARPIWMATWGRAGRAAPRCRVLLTGCLKGTEYRYWTFYTCVSRMQTCSTAASAPRFTYQPACMVPPRFAPQIQGAALWRALVLPRPSQRPWQLVTSPARMQRYVCCTTALLTAARGQEAAHSGTRTPGSQPVT